MPKITRKKAILLVVGFLVAGVALGLYHYRDKIKLIIADNRVWLRHSVDTPLKDLRTFGDDNRYLYLSYTEPSYQDVFVGQNYVTRREMGVWEKGMATFENKEFDKGEYFKLHIYDLKAKDPLKAVKTVDLYQLDLGLDYQGFLVAYTPGIVFYQGQDYQGLLLKKQGRASVQVLFNLKTHAIEAVPDELEDYVKQWEETHADLGVVSGAVHLNNLLRDELKLRRIHYSILSVADDPTQKLLKTNFETLYPDIAKKMVKDSGEIYLRQSYQTSADTDQFFDDIIHWFAPKGQDKLELYARRYNFKTEPETELYKTPVSSYADIKAWLAEHPE